MMLQQEQEDFVFEAMRSVIQSQVIHDVSNSDLSESNNHFGRPLELQETPARAKEHVKKAQYGSRASETVMVASVTQLKTNE